MFWFDASSVTSRRKACGGAVTRLKQQEKLEKFDDLCRSSSSNAASLTLRKKKEVRNLSAVVVSRRRAARQKVESHSIRKRGNLLEAVDPFYVFLQRTCASGHAGHLRSSSDPWVSCGRRPTTGLAFF